MLPVQTKQMRKGALGSCSLSVLSTRPFCRECVAAPLLPSGPRCLSVRSALRFGMPGARRAGTVRPMITTLSTASVSCSDLRYRAGHLTHAAELVRQAAASLPGSEALGSVAGIVRASFDVMARDRLARLIEAEQELDGAGRNLSGLADVLERDDAGLRG